MSEAKQQIVNFVEAKKDSFIEISDKIWDFAETRFDVKQSADTICELLEREGFSIERGIAQMENAFVATYGEGNPIIGILAEYDALGNLSQVCDLAEKVPLEKGGNGHGCGHNLLGSGAVGGAVGVKDFIIHSNIKGTVKLFGCPAEESGYGKAFMARAGVFDGLDSVLTWHPMDTNGAFSFSTLAVYQIYFNFKGRSAHASASPELGRSALDAAELMNVGVNFLREHVIDEARIHYAFIDAGGVSANVVQPTASLHYFIRAPKSEQVQPIYERIVKIAQGAALMTETELEIVWDSACANFIPNKALTTAMYENLKLVTPIQYTAEEIAYEQKFFDVLEDDLKRSIYNKMKAAFPNENAERIMEIASKPINDTVLPLVFPDKPMTASTDVGDASWVSPTAQVIIVCAPHGAPAHCWQWVATGKSKAAHKGMIAAAKVIALTAYDILTDPELVKKAKEEHVSNTGGQKYKSAIPDSVIPK